ncbi:MULTISPECIES: DUF4150 domain-containing protein [unclassified Methylobacter]|jgi:hypothetical protein|uniref:DUF4150 domain-containing protein n=1 Tax=unclassified Methylobacter TaxID=2635283 RepID=UPI002F95597F
MPVTIKVNGVANSLVHKGSNAISTATIPDVCKTPTPGGPVPIPYPNISQSATLAKGTTTVKADGGMMIAIKGSEFSLSNGDEPGSIGGVKSSTFIKESTWILYSFDVKMDGKNVCRLTDKKFQNHENTVDLAGAILAPTPVGMIVLECEPGWTPCQKAQMQAKANKLDSLAKQGKIKPRNTYKDGKPTLQRKAGNGWAAKFARDWNKPAPEGWPDSSNPAKQPKKFYDDCAKTNDPLGNNMEADHIHEMQLGGRAQGPFLWLDREVNGASGRQIKEQRNTTPNPTGFTTKNC